MTVGILFSLIAFSALLASLAVVALLRRQLRKVLVDLCDTENRAEFWVAVSGIWIVLLGLLAGTATLGYSGDGGTVDLFGGATSQVRVFLMGLLGAVVAIALVLLYAIQQRSAPRAPAAPPAAPPRLP